jgi:hypothetical protein
MLVLLIQLVLFTVCYGATCYGIMKVFEKVDDAIPSWAAFVPVYNVFVLGTQVARWEPVRCLLVLVPVVGMILLSLDVAKKFGKETGFALGLGLLPFVFYPLLGTSDAQYRSGSVAKFDRVA